MNRAQTIGFAALLSSAAAVAAPQVASAATGGEVGWRQIDCNRSQLQLFDWMQCRISSDETVEKNLKGTARHYVTLGGTPGAAAGMVLSVPQLDGFFAPYPPAESEMAIRTTVAGAGRKVDQWGPYQGFDKTGYMTFTSDGLNCVGFDHGGTYKKQPEQNGYLFLLRGYFCERGPIADPKARLVQYLEATRVGPASLQRNALGDRVEPLGGPVWQVSGAPLAPGHTAALTPAPMTVVPARVTWAGVVSQGSAQITPQSDGRTASFALGAPASNLSCNGSLTAMSGMIGVAAPSTGTWSTACNNGQTASGTYRSDVTGRGIGNGTDSLGRSVEIAFGN